MSEGLIGRCSEGLLYAQVELRTHSGHYLTVEHVLVADPLEFAASGSVWRSSRSRDCHIAGQCLDLLTEPGFLPAAQWSVSDVHSLHTLWKRWHLNTMRAGCVHMPEFSYPQGQDPESRERWDNRPVCPETGYRWGNSWLTEPLPEDVVTEVQRLIDLVSRSEQRGER
jgi:hypothetical protein